MWANSRATCEQPWGEKQEQTFSRTWILENNPGMFRMSNTTFTSSDESSHCWALQKHLKQEGGRESQQDWEGICIASDEWHNAQAAAAWMPKVGPLLLQLDPSWSFELQIPHFMGFCCNIAMQRLLATRVFFILKLKPWWETGLCNGLAQQLKNTFQHFYTRACRN